MRGHCAVDQHMMVNHQKVFRLSCIANTSAVTGAILQNVMFAAYFTSMTRNSPAVVDYRDLNRQDDQPDTNSTADTLSRARLAGCSRSPQRERLGRPVLLNDSPHLPRKLRGWCSRDRRKASPQVRVLTDPSVQRARFPGNPSSGRSGSGTAAGARFIARSGGVTGLGVTGVKKKIRTASNWRHPSCALTGMSVQCTTKWNNVINNIFSVINRRP